MSRLFVGLDLGGTKIAAGLVDELGAVSRRAERPTPASAGSAAVVADCVALIREVVGTATVEALGVGAAGVIDNATGGVVSATDAIAGWAGTPLGAELSQAIGLPVTVLNDVHAHALGESWRGAGRDRTNVLVATVGTGIGGALVADGRVQAGRHGFAGHLGHVISADAVGLRCTCGRQGHIEGLASGPSILAVYRSSGGSPLPDAKSVVALAETDDGTSDGTIARTVVSNAAGAFGRVLGGLVNTLDPEVIIVGGGVARPGGLWWDSMSTALAAETLLPFHHYVLAHPLLAEDSAIVGGARAAMLGRKSQ